MQPIADLCYCGRYPFVEIRYDDEALPVRVELEAFCPFIPFDAKNSGIPAICMRLRFTNFGERPVRASVAFSWTNDIGLVEKRIVANGTQGVRKNGLAGVLMSTRREDTLCGHEYAIVVREDDDIEVSVLPEWDAERDAGRFWQSFCTAGALAARMERPRPKHDPRTPPTTAPTGTIAARVSLEPGGSRDVTFALTWFMPNHYDAGGRFLGHAYANWFDGAWDVAQYMMAHEHELRARSREWQSLVYESNLPDFVKEAMIAHAYILALGAWWTRDGRLALGECPGWLMEMAALRPYNMFAVAMFFPELSLQGTELLAKYQRESGEIPTGLGNGCMDTPHYSSFRQQNSPSYVLNVYLNYLWIGGRDYLERTYDSVKRAIQFARTLDTDGDGLLNSYDITESAWDTWPVVGTSEYVNQFWLVALRAAQEMAAVMGDVEFANRCRQCADAAVASFEAQLWTGEYYAWYRDATYGDFSSTCFLGQHYGQLLGYLLGLGEVLPGEHVSKAIRSIARLNLPDSPFGPTTGVRPDGRRDLTSTRNAQSHCVAPTETFPFAAVCLQHNASDVGYAAVEKVWKVLVGTVRDPWSSRLLFDPDKGDNFYGVHYTDNLNAWLMLLAAEGLTCDVERGRLVLKPNIDPLLAPIFTPILYGKMRYATVRENGRVTSVEFDLTNLRREAVEVRELVLRCPCAYVAGVDVTSASGEVSQARFRDPRNDELILTTPLLLKPGQTRIRVVCEEG